MYVENEKCVEYTHHVTNGKEYFLKKVTIHFYSIKVQGYLRHKLYLIAHVNALKCKRPTCGEKQAEREM
jgi:hypothetical protein